jgi:5-methyltetrahydrofolate--homocysteine methyltransferase
MGNDLVELMADLKEQETLTLARESLDAGVDPVKILEDAKSAMEIVGKRFESREYFIPDLIMAGEILKGVSEIVKPRLKEGNKGTKQGKVLIGTVAGDIHDIGKDMVTFMLDVRGFDVLDLGIDVPVELFVEKTREFEPQVVGLSGFLTLAFGSMKKTVDALEQAGLRENLRIIIGGGQIDEEVRKCVRADAYGKDAIAAVSLCKQWIRG